MKTFNKTINRLKDDNNFLIDVVIKIWFKKRYEEVMESGDQDRIKIYNKINIDKIYKLFSPAYFRDSDYIRSTIVSREAGICFPDPKFDFLMFEKFITDFLDPYKKIYLSDAVPKELNIDNLKSLATSYTSFPSTPECYLSKINNSYALLYICETDNYINVEYLKSLLLKEYILNEFRVGIYQSGDVQYPSKMSDDIKDLKIGQITLIDRCLKELSIVIDVYNVKLIKDLIPVDPTEPTDPTDLTYAGIAKYDGVHKYTGVY